MKVRWTVVVIAGLVGALARPGIATDEIPFKGKAGESLGIVVLCNDCQSGAGKQCQTGAEEGWLNGKACGKCLLENNWGTPPQSPYDMHITGTLVDADNKPIKDRFVKLFLANGWGVRTRTGEDGTFRLTLGATVERKGEPAVLDIRMSSGQRASRRLWNGVSFSPTLPCQSRRMPSSSPTGVGSGSWPPMRVRSMGSSYTTIMKF